MQLTEREHLVGNLLAPDIGEMLAAKQNQDARKAMLELQAVEVADVLLAIDPRYRAVAFRLLPRDFAADVFTYLPDDQQEQLLTELGSAELAQLLNEMAPDDRAELIEEMPGQLAAKVLSLMRPEERHETQAILGYPSESVGRIMTPDYVAIRPQWTAQQTLDHVRQHGRDAETINYLYVVDDKGRLVDDLRLRRVLLARPDATVESLLTHQVTFLHATDDREEAVRMMDRYDRAALPVVTRDNVLVGIVTFDDVADVAEEEATEDIQKMGGVTALAEPYMSISLLRLARKRGTWLGVLFLGELLTATAMSYYEHAIERAAILAMFIPLIISSGGNSGSQASTLIIRAMALGEITLAQWWRVFRRELACGLLLGLSLGAIGMLRIHLWQWLGWYDYSIQYAGTITSYHMVAFTVAAALVGVVLWGSLMGAMLPFLIRLLRLDPATISAPFVATLVDVTGLIIYFTTASLLLHNVLHAAPG
ncbi:MAG: magnesium transporter [Phycisphaeraceae bacterium]